MTSNRLKKNIIELTRVSAEDNLSRPKIPLTVLLEDVRSLNNVGSVLRTADAFAVREVVMCGITGTPPHPEINKTALGAEDSVHWRHADNAVSEIRRLQQQGVHVCVLEQTHNSVPLNEFRPDPGRQYAVVAGNEVHGVSQAAVDAADTVLEIPQSGAKHSLNVAVSTALAIWHFYVPTLPR